MLPPRHQAHAKKAFWHYWPRRFFSERATVLLLLLAALIAMLISILMPTVPPQIRLAVFDTAENALAVVAIPAQRLSAMVEHLAGLSDMSSDLAALREENTKLKQWYDRARQLEAENQSLRGLVNLADLPRRNFITTRVIATSGSAFAQSVVVDAGRNQAVTTRMVAVVGDGVVGRVVAVQASTAQIVLITDVNARVPVVIENSRHRGVLTGDNSDTPLLRYLPEDASLNRGERVITSGHGGFFLAGLPVGRIVETTPGKVRVQPLADLRRLEFVQLVDFGQQNPFDAETVTP